MCAQTAATETGLPLLGIQKNTRPSPELPKEGKCAGVGRIHISPKELEEAWFLNNSRSVTALPCYYQHEGGFLLCAETTQLLFRALG